MSQRQVPTLAGIVQSDTASQANTLVERDPSGDVYANALRGNAATHTNGAHYKAVSASKTVSFTADDTKGLYLCDATSGAITVTLPAASTVTGLELTIKRTSSSNNIIVDGNASETIDGATTKTITTQYGYVTIRCDGSNWHIIASGGTIT